MLSNSSRMINCLKLFQEQFNNHKIHQPYNKLLQSFTCYLVIESINNINEIELIQNKSKIITIDKKCEGDKQYFLIICDKSIIVVSESKISFLSHFFSKEKDSTIIFVSNHVKEDHFISEFQFNFNNDINDFIKEDYEKIVESFSENLTINTQINHKDVARIWQLILPGFSAFLTNNCYQNLKKNKIEENTILFDEIKENEIIRLHSLGFSCSSHVELIYHIEREQLFVFKFFYSSESEKLFQREYNNYQNIKHPSIPRFYGIANFEGNTSLIIEYIKGKKLSEIDKMSLEIYDKINLIFQIMVIIEYFRNKKLIYRDLKPDNFIIDENKRITLIDFDNMIDNEEQKNIQNATQDFGNTYQAPEILNGNLKKYSFKEDVFSLGLIIYFILFEENPFKRYEKNQNIYIFSDFPKEFSELQKIFEKCIKFDPNERSGITSLIDSFYINFLPKIHQIIQFDTSDLVTNFIKYNFFPYWNLFYEYDDLDFKKQLDYFYKNDTIIIISKSILNNIHII